MAGSQHFSPGDIQFQLVYDKGQCAESSYLRIIYSTERSLLRSGGALIREGELIKEFSSEGERSFERGALSRAGAHSNKYGN